MLARKMIACAAVLSALAVSCATAGTYQILIENLVPGGMETGNPLTPPVAVVHGAGYQLYTPGGFASPGLEEVAEEGVTTTLEAEAGASADVTDVSVGPGPFFTTSSFTVEGAPGQLFSVVSMFGKTNDVFTGVRNIPLPEAGTGSVSYMTDTYDAGTEVNTGLVQDIPAYGNLYVGPEDNQAIALIASFTVLDDPLYGTLTWTWPPAARVTITAPDPTPVQPTSWGGVKALFR
jgi:hypothetical protein